MATDPTARIPVAYPYSFAHRTGSDVRIVLDLEPSVELGATAPVLRLSNGKRRVRGQATVSTNGDRHRVEVTVPSRGLTPGTWRLDLRPGPQQPLRRVRARLLVGRDPAVVLLPGAPPRPGIEPPRRTTDSAGRTRRVLRAARRAAGRFRGRVRG